MGHRERIVGCDDLEPVDSVTFSMTVIRETLHQGDLVGGGTSGVELTRAAEKLLSWQSLTHMLRAGSPTFSSCGRNARQESHMRLS